MFCFFFTVVKEQKQLIGLLVDTADIGVGLLYSSKKQANVSCLKVSFKLHYFVCLTDAVSLSIKVSLKLTKDFAFKPKTLAGHNNRQSSSSSSSNSYFKARISGKKYETSKTNNK